VTLITCPDCSKMVSHLATACPGCGRPVSSMETPSPASRLEAGDDDTLARHREMRSRAAGTEAPARHRHEPAEPPNIPPHAVSSARRANWLSSFWRVLAVAAWAVYMLVLVSEEKVPLGNPTAAIAELCGHTLFGAFCGLTAYYASRKRWSWAFGVVAVVYAIATVGTLAPR